MDNSMGSSAGQSIGANIKAKRRALGLKQEDLANKLGWTQANVSRVESRTKGPSAEALLAVAEALGCDVRELLGVETSERLVQGLDNEAKTFVLKTMESDPQFGLYLRSFVKESKDLTDKDWKFLAIHLKLALGYANDAIKSKRLHGNF
ncbi:MAG: helix-turn-helix transcriptional regulator [Synergistaceae bacterium]|jgi:transcriptional regulator with XRE-family HTH domain|nr:helix-turn-helix transcriptional regulator [Synergistaceae bacterium]